LEIELRKQVDLPISVRGITPSAISKASEKQIAKLQVQVGCQSLELAEVFDLRKLDDNKTLRWLGQLDQVHDLGRGMTGGSLLIESSVGSNVGLGMRGGSIQVNGSVGDFAGAQMSAGTINIDGDACHGVAAVLPGSTAGMTGGSILIGGSVGDYAGQRQRGGLIAIDGPAGKHFGYQMRAGTLVITGQVAGPVGLDMNRGTIICQLRPAQIGSHFAESCTREFSALRLIGRYLMKLGFDCGDLGLGAYQMFSGDLGNSAKGELFCQVGSQDQP